MAYVAVTSVNIKRKRIGIKVGDYIRLDFYLEPPEATNQKVIFTSNDDSIATVDEVGSVTAVGPGKAEITVTTEDGGFTDSVSITVAGQPATMADVAGVTVAPKSVSLKVGGRQKLTATVEPDDVDDRSVSWSVDDDSVALVDSSGLVEAVSEGSAVVTVTTVDGEFSDTSSVTVKALPVVDLSLLSNEHWPSNYLFRKSSIYLDIEEITLTNNQSARLLQTPEGFVLERIDIVVIKPAEVDLSFKFVADDEDIAQFLIEAGLDMVERKTVDGWQAGDYLPETWINLVNLGNEPKGKGRLAMSFIGYLIEPWR